MSEIFKQPNFELVAPNNEVLSAVANPIDLAEFKSVETQQLIDGMLAIANGTQGDIKKRTMVGLAAPQLGISKRLIVVDVVSTGKGETPDLRVYINPVISNRSEATELEREGCFSTNNVCGVVERSSEVTIQAYDRTGEAFTENYSGFTARIFQHEIDHLDGIRFPERISDPMRLHWVEPDQFGEYREQWRHWPNICDRQIWEQIKSGT